MKKGKNPSENFRGSNKALFRIKRKVRRAVIAFYMFVTALKKLGKFKLLPFFRSANQSFYIFVARKNAKNTRLVVK